MISIKQLIMALDDKYNFPFFDFASRAYGTYRKSGFINFRHYDRQHREIAKELNKELNSVINFHHDFESELYVRNFEKKFAKLCDAKFALGTSSGTSALQLSLTALGVGKGDEVITAPNSYIATALAISNVGAKPVFVDVDARTFNIDVDRIEEAITDRTKVIMPVHLYGQMADMQGVMKFAKKQGLFVVEDACQAFGAEYQGKNAGSFGDANCFSFFTGKNLGGLGNGGIVVSNNIGLIKKIDCLRNPEDETGSVIASKRTPCYLDAIQIAFLNAKLPHIKKWIEKKRKIAIEYNEAFRDLDITLPFEAEKCRHSYYSYVIKSQKRNALKRFLWKKGIETQIEYPLPLHLIKTFNYLDYKKGDFPITEKLNGEVLSLPISPFLKNEEIKKVSSEIKKFCFKYR